MRYLLILCLLIVGCAGIYDSRGSAILSVGNAEYKGIGADKVDVGGRCISWSLFKVGEPCQQR